MSRPSTYRGFTVRRHLADLARNAVAGWWARCLSSARAQARPVRLSPPGGWALVPSPYARASTRTADLYPDTRREP